MFEVKIKYEKLQENGTVKMTTEPYLVDALSFTEAEARVIDEMTPYIHGAFQIANIKRAKYTEIFHDDADTYYKSKLHFLTLNERTGEEKKVPVMVLAQAKDINAAVSLIVERMKGTMADYVIASVAETPIMDVFIYVKE